MDDTRLRLNDFFVSVQLRALKHVEFATGDKDEAMDILQDAMIRLAKNYSDKPDDWPQLFQRILQNLIKDWYRRKKVRNILVWWNQTGEDKNSLEEALPQEMSDDPHCYQGGSKSAGTPETLNYQQQISGKIVRAIRQLPFRQQQAFTLRAWWGHDTRDCAFAMECSEGSVKTHYSRAIARLRELLGDIDHE